MKRLAAIAVIAAACGGGGTPPAMVAKPAPAVTTPTATTPGTPELSPPARPPFPAAADLGKLPLAIEGLQLEWPLHVYIQKATAESPMMVFLGKDRYMAFWDEKDTKATRRLACWPALLEKVTGVYVARFIHPISITDAKVIHGVSVDEIVKCMATIGDKRQKSKTKDKRIVELSLATFTQLPGNWGLWTNDASEAKTIGEVLASASDTPNPLAAILQTQPLTPHWYASTLDYVWEAFGVQSLGTVFEYSKWYDDGPIAIRFIFTDVAAARLARARVDKLPDNVAEQSAVGDGLLEMLRTLRTRAQFTIEGTEVVLRGAMKWGEWQDVGFSIFYGAPPVRRPLTDAERQKLMRPLPN